MGTPSTCPSGLKKTEYGCVDISALGIETVTIPVGSFMMGCTAGDSDCGSDETRHNVQLTRPFSLMKTEVTQALYKKVMGENPSKFKGENRPVESVSWYDAVTFANKLSELEGLEKCYEINGTDVQWTNKDCKGWRLPTEAEWEYAARGGENYKYAGSNNVDEVAWYRESETHVVGQKKANGYGLYDMSGNVWEWVWDWYGEYPSGSQTDPLGSPSGSYRVLRGGGWYGKFVRVSDRGGVNPATGNRNFGFRLGRTP